MANKQTFRQLFFQSPLFLFMIENTKVFVVFLFRFERTKFAQHSVRHSAKHTSILFEREDVNIDLAFTPQDTFWQSGNWNTRKVHSEWQQVINNFTLKSKTMAYVPVCKTKMIMSARAVLWSAVADAIFFNSPTNNESSTHFFKSLSASCLCSFLLLKFKKRSWQLSCAASDFNYFSTTRPIEGEIK